MARHTAPYLVLLAALLVLPGVSSQGKEVDGEKLGEAEFFVELVPSDPVLQGTGSVGLQVQVEGELTCLEGSPPAPAVGTVMPERDVESLQLLFDPPQIRLEWEPIDGRLHTMNETVEVTATVLSFPGERMQMDFLLLLQPEERHAAHCTAQGYSVTQNESLASPLTIEPEASGQGRLPTEPDQLNWVPLTLAVALVALMSLFAFERQRRRGG